LWFLYVQINIIGRLPFLFVFVVEIDEMASALAAVPQSPPPTTDAARNAAVAVAKANKASNAGDGSFLFKIYFIF
jgi:hypothetical protein